MSTARQKILELRAWRAEGLLTEEEFCQRKNAILDREFSPCQTVSAAGDLAQQTDLGLLVGQELGGASKRYRLERLLGQGGMGQVWQATDLATHAELGHSDLVALKILPPQLTQSAALARLLIEEATLVRKLAHQNIVRVYEWAQDPATGSYFIIMEYLDGQDLESYLATQASCSLEQVLALLAPIAQALQYAWDRHQLVHRDLKPGNLFLTRQGEIKLLDFGIAARLRSTTHCSTEGGVAVWPPTRLSGAGTAGYRAPEASVQSHPFSPNMDVYAIAVMIYQMLQGSMPFGPQRHPGQHPAQPGMLSLAQWQVLQNGFAMDPEQRPASVRALLGALQDGTSQRAEALPHTARPAGYSSAQERQIAQAEAAARLRAEQRRQRKELAEQRRRQASAALQALIEKQRAARAIEEQRERERTPAGADTRPATPSDVQTSDAQAPAQMSWEDAKRYLAYISQATGRPVSPSSEAEWDILYRGNTPKGKC